MKDCIIQFMVYVELFKLSSNTRLIVNKTFVKAFLDILHRSIQKLTKNRHNIYKHIIFLTKSITDKIYSKYIVLVFTLDHSWILQFDSAIYIICVCKSIDLSTIGVQKIKKDEAFCKAAECISLVKRSWVDMIRRRKNKKI